jgi:outer membrane lipoprotein carrier protein
MIPHGRSLQLIAIIAAVLAVALWRPAAGAADSTAELSRVVGRIEAAHRQAKELQTEFVQTTTYEGFATPYVSKGRLSVQRPGKMRWDYREPSHHQIYVNDHEVIYFVPEHQQAIRSSMDREIQSPIPLMLLAGAATLSEQFTIDWADTPGVAHGRYRFRLAGKGEAAALAPLTIEVDAGDFLIRRVILHDPSGAETIFDFTQTKINSGLDAALFVFTPPAGIDVVDAPPLLPQTPRPAPMHPEPSTPKPEK